MKKRDIVVVAQFIGHNKCETFPKGKHPLGNADKSANYYTVTEVRDM